MIKMLNSLDNIIHRAELICETAKTIELDLYKQGYLNGDNTSRLSEIKADTHVIKTAAKNIQKDVANNDDI